MVTIRFSAIIPKHNPVPVKALNAALTRALSETVALAKSDFERTTRTWTRKPTFVVVAPFIDGQDLSALAGTDNVIYGYVVKGTRPHAIYPRRAQFLRFRGGYRAKTRIGVIGSRAGGAFGATVYSRGVQHPGTQARKFDMVIAERRRKNLQAKVNTYTRLAAKEGQ